jgi:hypothetical protein
VRPGDAYLEGIATIKVGRPNLSPEDIKKLEEAARNKKASG